MPELEPAPSRDKHCLLVDQGNSRIKWITAVWSAKSESWSLDLTTFGEGTADDLELAFGSGDMMPPEEVLFCSVAGDSDRARIRTLFERLTSTPVTLMVSEKNTGGINNGYVDFEQLGTDRWMAVVGAAAHYGYPVVVMDLGTATTLDAIDHEGNHMGGLILPGPGTMLDSLGVKTAMATEEERSAVRFSVHPGQAQSNTGAAITGGAISAQIGALEQFIESLQRELGSVLAKDPEVVVTGGAAGAILGKSDHSLVHDPMLVFKGMLVSRYGHIDERTEDNA